MIDLPAPDVRRPGPCGRRAAGDIGATSDMTDGMWDWYVLVTVAAIGACLLALAVTSAILTGW
jgi:hypothetical protein